MSRRNDEVMNIPKAREQLRYGKTIYDMPLKVAYYARVSTDKDDQLNSLENQAKFFEEMIFANSNWTFVRGYIDEGISGTGVKNRKEFLRMVEDAKDGKLDLILTKEISRFSRNTVDSIRYTESLLKHGVIVYFLSDNLNTIQEDAEFRLTIMSSLAQDEVRKLSERVKFGIRRMIKDRKLIGGNLTGYIKKNGVYEIHPEEAFIVRYLFQSYASGTMGFKKIGENLAKQGYYNRKGDPYSAPTLAKMLQNPRYKGYYTARLTEVEDYKTHKKRKVPKENQIIEKDEQIPALVSEELWDLANRIFYSRKKVVARHIQNQEIALKDAKYTEKLYCKEHQTIFLRSGGSTRKNNPTWACKIYKTKGVGKCASPIISEMLLDKMFACLFEKVFNEISDWQKEIVKDYQILKMKKKDWKDENTLKVQKLKHQKRKLLDLFLKEEISGEEFQIKNKELQAMIEHFNLTKENAVLAKDSESFDAMLRDKLVIRNNLAHWMKLLIERVTIEKVKDSRKKIKCVVSYHFDRLEDIVWIDLNSKEFLFFKS